MYLTEEIAKTNISIYTPKILKHILLHALTPQMANGEKSSTLRVTASVFVAYLLIYVEKSKKLLRARQRESRLQLKNHLQ